MPIPSPRKGKNPESKSEFISRCAGDGVMNKEFPEAKQRLAVCYRQWETKKANAAMVFTAAGEEYIVEKDAPPS